MITLRGKLMVNTQSRILDCELGQFEVQDERLTAIPSGEHTGFFEISSIELQTDNRNGSITCYQIAIINEFHLLTIEFQASVKSPHTEMQSPVATPSTLPLSPIDDTDSSNDEEVLDTTADEALFGRLWPLDATVKLDPTCGRDLFGKQRTRLQELGYQPNIKTQCWERTV